MSSAPPLSLVVPAYDEAQRIEGTLEALARWRAAGPGRGAELVLVDDGSGDATLPRLRGWALGRPDVQILALPHRGKGHAVRAGVLAARGARVAFVDADLATPLEELARLLAALDRGADVAIGSREGPGAVREGEPHYRHLLGRGFNRLVQALVLPGIEDTQCGLKAFRASAAQAVFARLRRYGPRAPTVRGANVTAFDVEVLLVARRLGLTIDSVPVRWRHERGSKVRPVYDTLRMARSVVQLALESRLGGGSA